MQLQEAIDLLSVERHRKPAVQRWQARPGGSLSPLPKRPARSSLPHPCHRINPPIMSIEAASDTTELEVSADSDHEQSSSHQPGTLIRLANHHISRYLMLVVAPSWVVVFRGTASGCQQAGQRNHDSKSHVRAAGVTTVRRHPTLRICGVFSRGIDPVGSCYAATAAVRRAQSVDGQR